ncbi:archease [Actinoplanes sp. NPDC049316]|uniref:archease n=1 Tax=Actinoplanes sp. NPDC049316 TaxID=3154727 RepID=UPI00342D5375
MGALPSYRSGAASDQGGRPMRAASAGFALLPHTADVIVAAWAPTATGCIEQAVRGLVAVFAEVPNHPAMREIPYACPPDSDTELLIRVLEEVIYLLEVREVVVSRANLRLTAAGGLAGALHAVPLAAVRQVGPPPKAVTRHGLVFAPDDSGWQCRITVDV